MTQRHQKRQATDGYMAVRSGVEKALEKTGTAWEEMTIHQVTLEGLDEYAAHFVPSHLSEPNHGRARSRIRDRLRQTDFRERIDNGFSR